jgi:hypothetical protein
MPLSMPVVTPVDMSSLNLHNVADPAAVSDASTMRRMGSYFDTSVATLVTSEVKLGQFTFTAVSGRRYKVEASGPLTNSAGYASTLRVRWATGSTVSTSGNVLFELPCAVAVNLTQMVAAAVEACTANSNALTAGTVSIGLFAQQTIAGTGGSARYGNGTPQPSMVAAYDVGT